MNSIETIFEIVKKSDFKVSTDTRDDLSGKVFFALKGPTFDGNTFANEAIKNGAVAVVTDDSKNSEKGMYIVKDVLSTLQSVAKLYRETFDIPIIAIGGSNGKTTSKELVRDVLSIKYKTHTTVGSFNNHIGLPLSILSMPKDTEIGVFEIGANHPGEHLNLLNILNPNFVVVTNNGMDHLEGFGSPEGSRLANKEIYDWAKINNATAFVNKKHQDLIEDSCETKRIIFSDIELATESSNPLSIKLENSTYATNLAGQYNIENIELAIAIGNNFKIDTSDALNAISKYVPSLKRSQIIKHNNTTYIVDCYNANPTSMKLSFDSFLSPKNDKLGVVLGDMLELGNYSTDEHTKVVNYVLANDIDYPIFVGNNFKKALENTSKKHYWFIDSERARNWLSTQNLSGYTFLLKGSRGMKIEKVLES